MTEELRLDWSQAQAARWCTVYRRVLATNLALQVVLGAVALVMPAWIADVTGWARAGPSGFVRLWGLQLIIIAALYLPGWFDPPNAKWPNVVGIAGRLATALLYLTLGGGFLWLAAADAGFALVLAWIYFRLARAVLMTRP